ncbi:hypothetical protein SISSUDRAFT_1065787 [Sistotremastrum suecicum HHB10207 ss-3]|uniref:Uncharacterized protein n=1 Tax=Sistotremastrum suecicum HHB10207 ss-3 TaxID=1314776 RepID=A0A165Z2Z1_9AGAM|nr:hypothetical protein SISSUDRAFT_1065787 [Sistotremastrum suecicum HHB10207 ss-3]
MSDRTISRLVNMGTSMVKKPAGSPEAFAMRAKWDLGSRQQIQDIYSIFLEWRRSVHTCPKSPRKGQKAKVARVAGPVPPSPISENIQIYEDPDCSQETLVDYSPHDDVNFFSSQKVTRKVTPPETPLPLHFDKSRVDMPNEIVIHERGGMSSPMTPSHSVDTAPDPRRIKVASIPLRRHALANVTNFDSPPAHSTPKDPQSTLIYSTPPPKPRHTAHQQTMPDNSPPFPVPSMAPNHTPLLVPMPPHYQHPATPHHAGYGQPYYHYYYPSPPPNTVQGSPTSNYLQSSASTWGHPWTP